jgi:hypothetical protein
MTLNAEDGQVYIYPMAISRLPTLIALTLSTPLVAAACGSGGLSSYDGNLKLEEMSADDATEYCKALREHAESVVSTKNAFCAIDAIAGSDEAMTDTELRTACKKFYDPCIASTEQPYAALSCNIFADVVKTCQGLTVAELNACIDERIPVFQSLADPDFCSTLTLAGLTMAAPSPKCDVVGGKCPALLQIQR